MFTVPSKLFTFRLWKCNSDYSETAVSGAGAAAAAATAAAAPPYCVWKYFKSIIHAVVLIDCFLLYCTCQTELINLYIYRESKQQDCSNPLPLLPEMLPSFFSDFVLITAVTVRYFAPKTNLNRLAADVCGATYLHLHAVNCLLIILMVYQSGRFSLHKKVNDCRHQKYFVIRNN